jgi:hypothetical protein
MLAALESKLTALIGDSLAARDHTAVHRAPGPGEPPEPGAGLVLVSLAEVLGEGSFEAGLRAIARNGGGPHSRRIVPVSFRATVDFAVRPATDTAAALTEARALALDDMATVVHALDPADVRSGEAFVTAEPDPGFLVHSLAFEKGTLNRDLDGPSVTGRLHYGGRADIWPPSVAGPEGEIRAVDALVAPLPVTIVVDDTVVAAGGSTRLRVRGVRPSRLVDAGGTRAVASLAVSVASDLPPAQRGAITSGDAGPETGLRIVPTAVPETVLVYQAPTGNLGTTRVEFVAVHLATAGGGRGVLLGSAAIRLMGSP